jgi:hypothetical protein
MTFLGRVEEQESLIRQALFEEERNSSVASTATEAVSCLKELADKVTDAVGSSFTWLQDTVRSAGRSIKDTTTRNLTRVKEYSEEQIGRLVENVIFSKMVSPSSAFDTSPSSPEDRKVVQDYLDNVLRADDFLSSEPHRREVIDVVLKHLHETTERLILDASTPEERERILFWRRAMVMEIFTKEYSRLFSLKEGDEVDIPLEDENNNPIMVRYVITHHMQFCDPGRGDQPFYIMQAADDNKKDSYAPFLVYPSTRSTTIESVLINADVKGPGKTVFDATKDQLQGILETLPPVRIFGYSQGGALAARAFVVFNKHISAEPRFASIVYSSPGVEKEILKEYTELKAADAPAIDNFIHFANKADFVDKTGYLIGKVYEVDDGTLEDFGNPWKHHVGTKFFRGETRCRAVDVAAENKSKLRAVQIFMRNNIVRLPVRITNYVKPYIMKFLHGIIVDPLGDVTEEDGVAETKEGVMVERRDSAMFDFFSGTQEDEYLSGRLVTII